MGSSLARDAKKAVALLREHIHNDLGEHDPVIDLILAAVLALPVVRAIKAIQAAMTGHDGWCAVRPPLIPLKNRPLIASGTRCRHDSVRQAPSACGRPGPPCRHTSTATYKTQREA